LKYPTHSRVAMEGGSEHEFDGPLPDYFYCQSGVVPCRQGENGIEVLLITSIRKGKWGIPKGVIEPELTAQESAAHEALEEAGVEGFVFADPVGSYTNDKWGGVCEVSVYPMVVHTVHQTWPESEVRSRKWVSGASAHEAVQRKKLVPLVQAAIKVVEAYFRNCTESRL